MSPWEEIEYDFELLDDYMDIMIDLIASREFIGSRRNQLPTFEYFKQNLGDKRYDLMNKNFYTNWTHSRCFTHSLMGITHDGIVKHSFRYKYGIWMSCPYGFELEVIE